MTPLGSRERREFLPAALELLVTPPSPLAGGLLLTICGVFTFLIVWSVVSVVDIHAVVLGKVQPSGMSKVVQSLEPGRVVAIPAAEGAPVAAGDVLVELDPVETAADLQSITLDLGSASAEMQRRRAAIAAARSPGLEAPPLVLAKEIDPAVRDRERDVLEADLAQLRALMASLDSQRLEKIATARRLEASIGARTELIALARERVGMRDDILKNGAGSRALVIEAMQQLQSQLIVDASERAQVAELAAAVSSLERRVDEARAQFIADQAQKLLDVGRKRDRLEQDLVKARSRAERMVLRSPIAGTVQQVTVTTIGQVVTSGQVLMTVVPAHAPVEVVGMLANKDAGFLDVGQRAVVKVDAYPFTRYGTLDAEVVRIARESVAEKDVAAGPAGLPSPRAGGQNLVFPVTLRLLQPTLRVDGRDLALAPGLTVTAEVTTGQRRVIDFVLSPIREAADRVGRER